MENQCGLLHSIDANNGKKYFILAEFKENFSCRICITDNVKTWQSVVDESSVVNSAEETSTKLTEYHTMMKSALSGIPNNQKFYYDVKEEESSSTLVLEWKKVEENVKFSLGTIVLQLSAENGLKRILENCSLSFKSLYSALENNKEECVELRKRQETLQSHLEQCTSLKDNLQTELLAKFVLVINEKKAKIRSLQEQLSYFRNKTSSSNTTSKNDEETPRTNTATTVNISKKTKKLKIDSDDDLDTILPKRNRYVKKQAVAVAVSPTKTKQIESVSPVKFPSDANATTSSDSTVDVNELIEEI